MAVRKIGAILKLGELRRALEKSEARAGHKYVSRKPDGKGGWIYTYAAGHEEEIRPHEKLGMHPTIGAKVLRADEKHAHVAFGGGEYAIPIPHGALAHVKSDLEGRVESSLHSGDAAIDAVLEGRAQFLGKGDDGLAFKVGDRVVKVSTVVPYNIFNTFYRTPEAALAQARTQHETQSAMREAGVTGLLHERFVTHDGRGYTIKPHVEIPEKLTKEQLDKVHSHVLSMHEKGYVLGDDVQVGLHDGEPVLFDVGKAHKSDREQARADDLSSVEALYRKHGEDYVPRGGSLTRKWEQSLRMAMVLPPKNDAGRDKLAKQLLALAEGKRAEAEDDLDREIIDEDLRNALKKLEREHLMKKSITIAALREQLRKSPVLAVPVKRRFAIEPTLTLALVKAATPPAGFTMAPHSKNGGYRKKVGGKWIYWYPDDQASHTVKPQWSEAHFAAGKFDRDPEHWTWKLTQQKIIGGVPGGVDFQSKAPVKIAGMPNRLWQVVEAETEPGWARLRDVNGKETRLVEHERVIPVVWRLPSAAPPEREDEDEERSTEGGEPYDPTKGGDDEWEVAGYAGTRLPVFEGSTAPRGTALWGVENGAYQFKAVTQIVTDADGKPRKVKRTEPYVPDAMKVKLISEFEPLLTKAAKRAFKLHALKPIYEVGHDGKKQNVALIDLQTAATEGLLRALQNYRGGASFAGLAQHYVNGYVHAEAGRMRLGGMSLASRELRMLPGFIAARAEAARAGSEPTAEQIAAKWRLKKRDLHRGLSAEQGMQDVPLGSYKLRGVAEPRAPGERRRPEAPRSVQTYPGRVELAERFVGLLSGEQGLAGAGPDVATEGDVFPGTGGRALSTEPKISAQGEIKKQLRALEEHVISTERATYRSNTADVLTRLLGLGDDEPASVAEISRTAKIEKKRGDKWVRVQDGSQKRDLVQRFVDEGLAHLKREFEGSDVAGAIETAAGRHGSKNVVPPGPTYNEIIRSKAAKVSDAQVKAWRASETERLRSLRDRYAHDLSRHEPGSPGHETAKTLLAQVDDAVKQVKTASKRRIAIRVVLDAQGESPEIRRLQTQFVSIDPYSPENDYHEVSVTDLKGNTRKMRVRAITALNDPWSRPVGSFQKSERSELTSGMLAEQLRWPLVTRVLYAPSDRLAMLPTQARAHLEDLVGLT